MKKCKVIQAFLTNNGGLSGYMLRNFEYINKQKFEFLFIYVDKNFKNKKIYENMGAKFVYINKEDFINYWYSLIKFLSKNNYDILHLHLSGANIFLLLIAKIFFKGKIIIHSHNSRVIDKSFLKRKIKFYAHNISKIFIPYLCDYYCACSEIAAKWMFPESVIKNNLYRICKIAIDIEKFKFNKEKRIELRDKYNLKKSNISIGCVAAFVYQKNHMFLIKGMVDLLSEYRDIKLYLIGTGYELKHIKDIVIKNNLEKQIIFLGEVNNVNEFMQMFDILVLTSFFEGQPTVIIEAQTSGLQCIISDKITKEIRLTDLVKFLPIDNGFNLWKKNILNLKNKKRDCYYQILKEKGYDIRIEIKKIEEMYLDLLDN